MYFIGGHIYFLLPPRFSSKLWLSYLGPSLVLSCDERDARQAARDQALNLGTPATAQDAQL